MRQKGFTVIELITVILFLVIVSVVLFVQLSDMNTQKINTEKKTAINAIYYSLEEGFYPKNQYYPESIKDDTLTTMDPALLTDPSGVKIGNADSAYRYEPTDCSEGKCKSYTLRTSLTGEADFIKTNQKR